MASGEMKAGAETLSKAANMVTAAKADFDKHSAQLQSQIQAAQSTWVGQGGSAFQSLGTAWNERQTKILSALNEFEQSLQSTQKDNQSTDSNQHGSMQGLTGRLGEVPGKY